MSAPKIGKNCSVKLGGTAVVGIGNWEMTGVQMDVVEVSAMGDTFKAYLAALADGGQVTFAGYYDPTDSTGQTAMETYCEAGTIVTSLRLYVDSTSYWTPATTSQTGSGVIITNYRVTADKSGLAQVSFTGKVTGKLALV